MTDELKFTTEYIANCRKATGGPWVFSEPREALAEIERLQAQVAERDALIANMVTTGNRIFELAKPEYRAWEKAQLEKWNALISE